MRTLALAALIACAGFAHAEGPKYETMNGCDDGRWKEWESIIIGFDGYPDEQEDARHVRDVNRQACADWKSGKLTAEHATKGYDREVDAWTKRVEQREQRRKDEGTSSGQG